MRKTSVTCVGLMLMLTSFNGAFVYVAVTDVVRQITFTLKKVMDRIESTSRTTLLAYTDARLESPGYRVIQRSL